jgi:hypothetical protein
MLFTSFPLHYVYHPLAQLIQRKDVHRKHGKRPSKEQKLILQRLGYDPADWLICKNTAEELVVECRYTGKHRTIPKSQLT